MLCSENKNGDARSEAGMTEKASGVTKVSRLSACYLLIVRIWKRGPGGGAPCVKNDDYYEIVVEKLGSKGRSPLRR